MILFSRVKKSIVVPIYKGANTRWSKITDVNLTLVVCKQMEHVRSSYLSKIWDNKDWLFEG
jgi:hypothetical protein